MVRKSFFIDLRRSHRYGAVLKEKRSVADIKSCRAWIIERALLEGFSHNSWALRRHEMYTEMDSWAENAAVGT
jgi:hypothetical protein